MQVHIAAITYFFKVYPTPFEVRRPDTPDFYDIMTNNHIINTRYL